MTEFIIIKPGESPSGILLDAIATEGKYQWSFGDAVAIPEGTFHESLASVDVYMPISVQNKLLGMFESEESFFSFLQKLIDEARVHGAKWYSSESNREKRELREQRLDDNGQPFVRLSVDYIKSDDGNIATIALF
ncbi:MAG TPA: hypothetical protein VHQ20_01720 [Patescibacteria group bacterium]|nr:hypothetical protein [Patescibacteria group bacterium]